MCAHKQSCCHRTKQAANDEEGGNCKKHDKLYALHFIRRAAQGNAHDFRFRFSCMRCAGLACFFADRLLRNTALPWVGRVGMAAEHLCRADASSSAVLR